MVDPVKRIYPGRVSIRRFFWLPLGASAVVVLVLLAGLVAMSWRGLDRLHPVQNHLVHIARIQDLGLSMEQTLLKGLRGTRVDRTELERLREEMLGIAALEGAMHPDTNSALGRIAQRIVQPVPDSVELLFQMLTQVRAVLTHERERHEVLLSDVAESTRMELRLAVVLHRERSDREDVEYTLAVEDRKLRLSFPEGWLAERPLTAADLKQEASRVKAAGYRLKFK